MNLAICDDERALCNALKEQLINYLEGERGLRIDIFYSGEELVEGYQRCSYDAVFLDVYMGGISGFETAKILTEKYRDTNIIFFTSNNSLVYDSFDYQPFYFIRKDNYMEVLPKVLEKLKMDLKQKGGFFLDDNNGNERVPVGNIYYIESDKHNILIHTTKYDYEIRRTLTEAQEQLSNYDFIKIHKKYLVNLKFIRKINTVQDKVILTNDVELDISRRSRESVLESYKKYQRRMKNI